MIAEHVFIRDDYVTIRPGQPYRILPFGRIVKDGKVRDITPDLARRFKLPHFRPPIKLGSHADETPAGGHIVELEVRDDGLYAIPEYNERGLTSLEQGEYRYQSPEIVWDGNFENPDTGEPIEGPLIVGDALLHMPHLGEQAALYSVQTIEEKQPMADTQEGMVTVPTSWLDKLFGRDPEPAEKPPEPQVADKDDYAAELKAERGKVEQLTAELEAMKAQAGREQRIDHFAGELADGPLAEDGDLHELLADLPEEKAEAILTRVKAIGAQADAAGLEDDVGHSGDEGTANPQMQFDAAVKAKMGDKEMGYTAAFQAVAVERPDLYAEYLRS